MYHLARRVLADHYRKNRNHTPGASDAHLVLEQMPDEAADSRAQAAASDDLERMRHAFSLLPNEQREILTLHRFQHLAHQEIARLLDCSVSAAKVRLHRAVKALRDKYLRLDTDPSLNPNLSSR